MKRTLWTIGIVALISAFLAGFGTPGRALYWPGILDFTGEPYAIAMMTVDTIAATIILLPPHGKAQAAIGLTFMLQIAVYFARLLHGDSFNVDSFWWQLSALAILQLGIAGGWWLHELVNRWRPVPGRDAIAGAAHREGMDG